MSPSAIDVQRKTLGIERKTLGEGKKDPWYREEDSLYEVITIPAPCYLPSPFAHPSVCHLRCLRKANLRNANVKDDKLRPQQSIAKDLIRLTLITLDSANAIGLADGLVDDGVAREGRIEACRADSDSERWEVWVDASRAVRADATRNCAQSG